MADIIELRFPFSGLVANLNKKLGDSVKKGEIIASLTRTTLQSELDRQLAEYEKVRADFEIFALQNPDPSDDISKYQKTARQAQLNASVKDVEIAKAKLDLVDLVCPCNAAVLSTGGILQGIYITPSANPVTLLDSDSLRFQIEVGSHDAPFFASERKAVITIGAQDKKVHAISKPAAITLLSKAPYFTYLVDIIPDDFLDILPGMEGSIEFSDL
ncbi:hypothetical protein A2397_00155 [Candidatus Amesbacteria bacterium RIFOXYB1_FULL_44_23]|uniref:Uncharacterized protein n=1 Tax=Candidatus Amesbacteria bacterium RIFOXYB1_FULL_44_23 TaxID=1797263 RepID=A0A1F4ZX54_9BACT|nr:MAG: hypothetical protein A2397_00155 [Candidatus Amesbacteria bacterium RIFOXYB1_FULL_44_23]